MTFRPFDVLVVPFPYSDQLAERRRPALVVSDPALERQSGLVWVAMITSSGRTPVLGDVPIKDQGAAGLPAPSIVRAGKIATIEPHRVIRRAGALAAADQRTVKSALAACAAF